MHAVTPTTPSVRYVQPGALKRASNRRNAQKSTGPKTAAGKRRASLNRLEHNLIPQAVEKQIRARGEDPRDFRRLHVDLIALFSPASVETVRLVEMLAESWWEKARRLRQSPAGSAGPVDTGDLDWRLNELLMLVINLQRRRRERWCERLDAVLGRGMRSISDLRGRIERRLFIFGGRRETRRYPKERPKWPKGAAFTAFVEQFLSELFQESLTAFPARGAESEEMPGEDRNERERSQVN